jgi:hypothetical protein
MMTYLNNIAAAIMLISSTFVVYGNLGRLN